MCSVSDLVISFFEGVQNKLLNVDDSIYIPVTRAEYTVLISAFNVRYISLSLSLSLSVFEWVCVWVHYLCLGSMWVVARKGMVGASCLWWQEGIENCQIF